MVHGSTVKVVAKISADSVGTHQYVVTNNLNDFVTTINSTITAHPEFSVATTTLPDKILVGDVTESNVNVTAANFYGNISGNGVIPIGGIIMWSGSIDTIPSGWTLCNGSNGTPDLGDRFVMGASTWLAPGNTGGSNTTYLTVKQLPSHSHAYTTTSNNENNGFTFTGDDGVSKYYNRYNRFKPMQGDFS